MPPKTKSKSVKLSFSLVQFNKTLDKLQALSRESAVLDATRARIRRQYNTILADQFESLAVELEKAPTPQVVADVATMFHNFYNILRKQLAAEGAEPKKKNLSANKAK